MYRGVLEKLVFEVKDDMKNVFVLEQYIDVNYLIFDLFIYLESNVYEIYF